MNTIQEHLARISKALLAVASQKKIEPLGNALVILNQDWPVLTKEGNQLLRSTKSALDEYETGYSEKIDLSKEYNKFVVQVKAKLESTLQEEVKEADKGIHNADAAKLRDGIIHNRMFVGTAPIILVTNPPIFADKLKALGFPVTTFEGYAVLKDQLVVGAHQSWIDKNSIKGPKNKAVDAYEELLEIARLKHPRHTVAARGLSWFESRWAWMPAEEELAAIQRAVGKLKIVSWGFAFPGAAPKVKADVE